MPADVDTVTMREHAGNVASAIAQADLSGDDLTRSPPTAAEVVAAPDLCSRLLGTLSGPCARPAMP